MACVQQYECIFFLFRHSLKHTRQVFYEYDKRKKTSFALCKAIRNMMNGEKYNWKSGSWNDFSL